jgi:hypothetical protein
MQIRSTEHYDFSSEGFSNESDGSGNSLLDHASSITPHMFLKTHCRFRLHTTDATFDLDDLIDQLGSYLGEHHAPTELS